MLVSFWNRSHVRGRECPHVQGRECPHVRGRQCCCSFFMTAISDLHASYWFNHTGQPSCTQTALAQSPPSRLCALPAHDTRRHASNPSPDGATTVAAEADASSVNVRPEGSFNSSPSSIIRKVVPMHRLIQKSFFTSSTSCARRAASSASSRARPPVLVGRLSPLAARHDPKLSCHS